MVVVAMLLNAVLTASDLVRVKDETTNSSVMMLVYDAPVDEDGNPTGEATPGGGSRHFADVRAGTDSLHPDHRPHPGRSCLCDPQLGAR